MNEEENNLEQDVNRLMQVRREKLEELRKNKQKSVDDYVDQIIEILK